MINLFGDMKSGDRSRQQNVLDTETNRQQEGLNTLNTNVLNPMNQGMANNYNRSADQAFGDYGDIMGRYKNYMDDPESFSFERAKGERISPSTISYSRSPELAEAMKGYSEFSKTGGFDDNAQRDIRARGISPIRAAYGNTMMELNRAKSLGGGGGANNYIAAMSRAQRDLPQQLADAEQNVNADLAEKIQRGRLSGLGGLSETSLADTGFGQQAQLANQSATMQSRLANQDVGLRASLANQGAGMQMKGNKLGAISGMGSLYGTSPGMASMFGNQVLNSSGQLLQGQGLQGNISQNKIGGQQNIASMPTGFQSFLNNAGRIGQIGSNIASIWSGGMGGGGGMQLPGTPMPKPQVPGRMY